MKNNHLVFIGILWTLVFCGSAVISDGIVRVLTMQGLPSSEMLFIRAAGGTLMLLPFMLQHNLLFTVSKQTLKRHAMRGGFVFISVSLWFYILKHTDFTALMAIGFTSPL